MGVFLFLYFLKIKITKIYISIYNLQFYTLVARGRGDRVPVALPVGDCMASACGGRRATSAAPFGYEDLSARCSVLPVHAFAVRVPSYYTASAAHGLTPSEAMHLDASAAHVELACTACIEACW